MGAPHIPDEVRTTYTGLVEAGRFTWEGLREYASQQEELARGARSMGTHESGGWLPVIALCDEHVQAEPDKAARTKSRGTERAVDPGATEKRGG